MTLRISCRTGAMKSPRRRTASFEVGGRYVFIARTAYWLGVSPVRFSPKPGASALERREHFLRVAIRLHAVPRLLHLAALVDQERRPDHALAAARPLAPRAVGIVGLAIGVAEQWELELELLLERAVRRGIVARAADHRYPARLERRQVVVELAGLDGATRCVVLRVEVHDVILATHRVGRDELPVLVGQRE